VRLNKAKMGIVIIILLALVPLYIIFNGSGAEKTVLQKVAVKTEKVNKEDFEEKPAEGIPQKDDTEEAAARAEESKADSSAMTKNAPSDQNNESGKLSDFLVVIDPGHQLRANMEKEPIGPGASETKIKVSGGTTGVATRKPEYVLTLEASLILGKLLEENGVKVMYTRTTHNVDISNRERAEMANQSGADLFVRIHADGATDHDVSGLSVLTPAETSPYTGGIYQDSLQASQFIIQQAKNDPAVKVNGVKFRSDLSGFNWSQVPSTLIEMGYMTNPAEDKNLSNPEYLRALLNGVADGILQYARFKGE
jgi:N-acetylmuramoyl-L-alanine amidase